MANIEVDEVEFQRNAGLRKTVEAMLANPKAREGFLRGYKEAFPNASVPEIDARRPVDEAVDGVKKELADFRAEVAKEREEREKQRALDTLEAKWSAGREKLRSARYTDEGIAAVEKLMQEKGIMDHEDGLAIFERLNPPAEPVSPTGGTGSWNFFEPADDGDDFLKKLMESHGNDEAAVNQMVRKTLGEIRGSRGR